MPVEDTEIETEIKASPPEVELTPVKFDSKPTQPPPPGPRETPRELIPSPLIPNGRHLQRINRLTLIYYHPSTAEH